MSCPPPVLPQPLTTSAITMEQVKSFAIASGDSNPIHLSNEAAQAAGLSGPVLHGMIVVGHLENYLERMIDHQIEELQVRFVRPVPVGSALAMSVRHIGPPAERLHLRVIVNIEGGVLVAIGEARMARRINDPGETREF